MRLKRQKPKALAQFFGFSLGCGQQLLVATVHAIKIADGDNAAA
jgi:hypothetical protein